MFVEKVKNNGKDYLRLVQSVRVTNKDGYKVSQKKVVLNIGPLERYDDGKPDYVKRLKDSFKAGNPIIPSLLPYCSELPPSETYRFSVQEGSPDCFGHPKLFSQVLIERILEELGLNYFFSAYKGFSKLQYDVYGFAKLLIFGRILNPVSKSATVKQNSDYHEPVLGEHNPDNVYDALTFIAENKDKIIRRINTNLVKKAGRSPQIIYYDVTNFYFETEDPDDDILDDDGNILEKGIRKMGVSKEFRKQPIVQMGLFMDDDGIPIAVETFPGNTLDHLTFRLALKKNIDNLDLSRFILIADRGICQYINLLPVLNAGNGYILSKSILKCPKKEQQWIYDDNDFIHVGDDFKYKSRIIKRSAKDENGTVHTFDEKVVVYWSKKFHDRQEKENKNFLEFLDKLQQSPERFRISSMEAKSVKKFLKKDYVNKKTGELVDSSDIKPFIDFDKVEEYKKSFGYYQIVTSELTMDPVEVIDKYHGLTQIEEQFRAMKSELQTRPMYVRTPEHIQAHLLICMIALIIMRIIQKRLKDSGIVPTNESNCWNVGLSGKRIQQALNKWKVDSLPSDLYRFMDVDDADLKLILDAFQVDIPAKLYRKSELKNIKTKIKVFM